MLDRITLLALDDEALLRLCRQECYRASGPGGQHRNTTDSAVRLTFEASHASDALPVSVVAQCADHRSQHRNRAQALKRLRLALAIELRLTLGDQAVQSWDGSWKLGRKDRRYAAFLAHVLDVMAHHDWAVGLSASGLGSTTGKLVRVLANDPRAWNAVNQQRAKFELVNLRRP